MDPRQDAQEARPRRSQQGYGSQFAYTTPGRLLGPTGSQGLSQDFTHGSLQRQTEPQDVPSNFYLYMDKSPSSVNAAFLYAQASQVFPHGYSQDRLSWNPASGYRHPGSQGFPMVPTGGFEQEVFTLSTPSCKVAKPQDTYSGLGGASSWVPAPMNMSYGQVSQPLDSPELENPRRRNLHSHFLVLELPFQD